MDFLPPLLSFLFMQAEPTPDLAPEPVPALLPVPASTTEPVPAPVSASASAPTPVPAQVFPVTIAVSMGGGLFRQGDSSHGRAGEGQVAVDWFLRRPVVDDGTPDGLQAYLQRADHLALGVGGSLSSAEFSDANAIYPLFGKYGDKRFVGRLAGLFYRRWAVFGGEVDYARDSSRLLSTPETGAAAEERTQRQFLRPSTTVGFRDQTSELRVSYIYVAYFDNPTTLNGALRNVELGVPNLGASYFRKPGWGQGRALGRFVLHDSAYFTLEAFTLADGGGFSAKYEIFPNPRVGIWLGGDFQEEQTNSWPLASSDDLNVSLTVIGYVVAHGEIGVEWWRSNHFALLGWIRGGMIRETVGPREAYGTETPYLEFIANLGIVMRVRGRTMAGDASQAK